MNHGDTVRTTSKPHWGEGTFWKLSTEQPEIVGVRFEVEYTICDEVRHDWKILSFHISHLIPVDPEAKT